MAQSYTIPFKGKLQWPNILHQASLLVVPSHPSNTISGTQSLKHGLLGDRSKHSGLSISLASVPLKTTTPILPSF